MWTLHAVHIFLIRSIVVLIGGGRFSTRVKVGRVHKKPLRVDMEIWIQIGKVGSIRLAPLLSLWGKRKVQRISLVQALGVELAW